MRKQFNLILAIIALLIIVGCTKNYHASVDEEPLRSEQERKQKELKEKYNIPEEVKQARQMNQGSDTSYFLGLIENKNKSSLWVAFSIKDQAVKEKLTIPLPDNTPSKFVLGTSFSSKSNSIFVYCINQDYSEYVSLTLLNYSKSTKKWNSFALSADNGTFGNFKELPWYNKSFLIYNYESNDIFPNLKFQTLVLSPELKVLDETFIEPIVIRDLNRLDYTFISNREYIRALNTNITENIIRITRKSTIPIPVESDKPEEEGKTTYDLGFWDVKITDDDSLLKDITLTEKNTTELNLVDGKIKVEINIIAWKNSPTGDHKIEIIETKYINPKTGLLIN